jgi:hypothetical protein
MIEQKDVLAWHGEPCLVEVMEGPDDPDRPRRVYAFTVEPPEEFQEHIRQEMLGQAEGVVEALRGAGVVLEDDFDLGEKLDDMVQLDHMAVAEPFELCFN